MSASTRPLRRGQARRILLVGAAAVALAGCGNTDATTTTEPVQPVGDVRVGSISYLAQCRDWNAGTRAQKLATIADIRNQINTGDAGVENPTLNDEEAYGLFQRACSHDYATAFRLYKLYFRASAYEPVLVP